MIKLCAVKIINLRDKILCLNAFRSSSISGKNFNSFGNFWENLQIEGERDEKELLMLSCLLVGNDAVNQLIKILKNKNK